MTKQGSWQKGDVSEVSNITPGIFRLKWAGHGRPYDDGQAKRQHPLARWNFSFCWRSAMDGWVKRQIRKDGMI